MLFINYSVIIHIHRKFLYNNKFVSVLLYLAYGKQDYQMQVNNGQTIRKNEAYCKFVDLLFSSLETFLSIIEFKQVYTMLHAYFQLEGSCAFFCTPTTNG